MTTLKITKPQFSLYTIMQPTQSFTFC